MNAIDFCTRVKGPVKKHGHILINARDLDVHVIFVSIYWLKHPFYRSTIMHVFQIINKILLTIYVVYKIANIKHVAKICLLPKHDYFAGFLYMPF